MTEERIQAALAHYEAQLRSWTDKHQDAHAFEESFVRFTRENRTSVRRGEGPGNRFFPSL